MFDNIIQRGQYLLNEFQLYFLADRIIGVYPQIKAKKNRVNLFDYHPELTSFYRQNNNRWNLGDSLGIVITEWMLAKRNLSLNTPVNRRKHFYCVGSNIIGAYQNATIWGSGALHPPGIKLKRFLTTSPMRKLDLRAVRGPLSRNLLIELGHKCPEIYGDPAILMPFIYKGKTVEESKKKDVIIIPQYATEKVVREKYSNYPIVSMNTNDYETVIDAIVSSKKVITSSLHGIILADAYKIPVVFYRGLDHVYDFKYLDYYASTGRNNVTIANTIEEALDMIPPASPDLEKLQKGLISSFPYDLWEEQK